MNADGSGLVKIGNGEHPVLPDKVPSVLRRPPDRAASHRQVHG